MRNFLLGLMVMASLHAFCEPQHELAEFDAAVARFRLSKAANQLVGRMAAEAKIVRNLSEPTEALSVEEFNVRQKYKASEIAALVAEPGPALSRLGLLNGLFDYFERRQSLAAESVFELHSQTLWQVKKIQDGIQARRQIGKLEDELVVLDGLSKRLEMYFYGNKRTRPGLTLWSKWIEHLNGMLAAPEHLRPKDYIWLRHAWSKSLQKLQSDDFKKALTFAEDHRLLQELILEMKQSPLMSLIPRCQQLVLAEP